MSEKLSYSEQLKHPKWQKRRLEVLSAANFQCKRCGASEDTLHVHHRHYVKGRMVWEYDDSELIALCEFCHHEEHDNADLVAKFIYSIPDQYKSDLVSILAGISYVVTRDNEIINNSDPIMFMAGIAAIKSRELDLIGMDKLSDFLKTEIEAANIRKSERSKKIGLK